MLDVIGVLVVDGPPVAAPRLGGLPLPLRTLLVLQQAGVSALAVAGPSAAAWVEFACADDRVRMPLSALDRPPEQPFVAIAGHVLVDPCFLRALLAAPAVHRCDGSVVAVHRDLPRDTALLDGEGLPPFVSEGLCLPVRTDAQVRSAEDALYASLRKAHDGLISRAINRTISLRVTRLLALTGLRPNQVSVGILSFGVAAAFLAAYGTPVTLALAGMAFNLQSILDGCDGELARLTFRGSRTGEWIDTLGDDFTNYGYFAGASWGLYRAGLGTLPLVVGAVGLTAGLTASLIEYRYLLAIGSGDLLKYPIGFGHDARGAHHGATGLKRLLGALRPLFKRDFFVFMAMLAALAGQRATLVMVALFTGGAVLTLGAVVRSEWARRGVPPGQEGRV